MKLLLFYLAVVGSIFGAVLGLGTSLSAYSAWYDFLLTTVVSGAAYAGVLALPGLAYARWSRRGVSTAILYVIVSVVAGGVAGSAISDFVRELPHGRWRRVADPPGVVASMVVPRCFGAYGDSANDLVIVATSAGVRYTRPIDARPSAQWTSAVSMSPAPPRDTTCRRPGLSYAAPMKLGSIEARYLTVFSGVDTYEYVHYLLMADKSIWQWKDGGAAIASIMASFFMVILSATLPLIFCAALIRARWQEAEDPMASPPETTPRPGA